MTSALCDILNIKEIINDGAYEIGPLKHKVEDLPIVDIGAFIGISSAYLASSYPESKVLAVEPLQRNYDFLTANASLYGGQIVTKKCALMSQSGVTSVIESASRHPYMPLFSPGDGARKAMALSPLELIQSTGFSEELGILKVDIEGGEADLFGSGSMDEILERTRILMIETHDQFVPECTEAVEQAAANSSLILLSNNPHSIRVYSQV